MWASLYSHFDGLRNFRLSSWGQDTALIDSPSTIASAYKGLLSPALITTWTRLFKTTPTVAAQVAHQFIRRLDRDALGRLWKTRCEATIAWEKTHGIRHGAKVNPTAALVDMEQLWLCLPPGHVQLRIAASRPRRWLLPWCSGRSVGG